MIQGNTVFAGDSITVGLAPFVAVVGQKNTIAKGGMPASWLLGEMKKAAGKLDGNANFVVIIGTNDMGGGLAPEMIFQTITQIWAIAKAHGLRVYAATIPPFNGWSTYTKSWDQKRGAVNKMIYESSGPDAIIDLSRLLADSSDQNKLAAVYDSGDHLHPRKDKLGALITSEVERLASTLQVPAVPLPTGPVPDLQVAGGQALLYTLLAVGVGSAFLLGKKRGIF